MHPLEHPDPDVGCRYMCEHMHSVGDNEVMAEVLDTMPHLGQPLPPFPCPINTWDID